MSQLINFVKDFIISLIGDKCYVELVENLNVTNFECLKYSFSKVLGLGMVCGGAILKVPQIIKILMSKSTKGISVTSYFLEILALLISISYNVRFGYPFTTWGEYPFMAIQCFIVLFLIYFYKKTRKNLAYLLAPLLILLVIFNQTFIPNKLLQILQTCTVGITIAGRLPQIFANYKNRSTGELSALTVFFQCAGSLARVFTTLQEVDDYVVMAGNLIASSLNTVLFIQVLYYWRSASYLPLDSKKIGKGKPKNKKRI
ncbi:mannose-P-dolichol utilization defect 1 protein [Piromyces finnis]|uniref:Mannose-P-dolichol utilization defect 1 protein homolog n=1 Tax=Piromyces finnis TaxID=1754191 RepID=A0A1Y1V3Y4_9FUNG|nr:mannose-P-dolichol utilization defect 1 protein [Piromyces finnis]|eukprot:ORX45819.1 mannose-P-dolichol utilization defect 1 protein [Piromyces finnis]